MVVAARTGIVRQWMRILFVTEREQKHCLLFYFQVLLINALQVHIVLTMVIVLTVHVIALLG